MRILFLAPRFPFPPDTGAKIRTWNILKQLAKRCKIDLLCYSFDPSDKNHMHELEKVGLLKNPAKMAEDGGCWLHS